VLPYSYLSKKVLVLVSNDLGLGRGRGLGLDKKVLVTALIGHGFESEHRLFSHLGASAFSKLRSLAYSAHCTIKFVDCCNSLSYVATLRGRRIEQQRTSGSAMGVNSGAEQACLYIQICKNKSNK